MRYLALLLAGPIAVAWGTLARGAEPVDFPKDIRPILSDNCFKCHGPDAPSRKGKLRLDVRADALKGGASGEPAIVPGKPDKSELLNRILSHDEGEVMPPPESGKTITAAQKDKLKAWIAAGAEYQQHWAFIPPVRAALPSTRLQGWTKTPVDSFVLARLEKEGLKPSPEASREVWLRRVSLDLTGLPPSPKELDAFLADTSPDAPAKQVDRLLASPAYGERWARHWLDAARYADSDGFEKDKPRNVWMYRDWVVNALNRDLPYNQFILEQLAGDLLPNPTQDQLVATGFLRNSMINEEGGVDPEQFRMEAMFDRMDALGKSILGLTISCTQCHNHKYDPITQEEYYQLFSYLNDTHEASVATYTPEQQKLRAEIFGKITEIEDDLKHRTPDWKERLAAWEDGLNKLPKTPWTVLPAKNSGDNSQRYIYNDDKSLTAWGYAPTKWTSIFRADSELKSVSAIRMEMLNDPNLPLGGPGRSPIGLFALSEIEVEVSDAKSPDKKTKLKFKAALADYGNPEQPLGRMFDDRTQTKRITGPVGFAIDGRNETAWGIDAGPGRRNVPRTAVFIAEKPVATPNGATLNFSFRQMHGGWNSDDNQNNNLGRFRLSATDAAGPTADPVPSLQPILKTPRGDRTEAQFNALFSHWRKTVADWKPENDRIEALWAKHPAGTSQLTMMARDQSRQSFLLARGDFLKPAKPVKPGVPAALNPIAPDAPGNRLGLANWIVARNAPTTARAIVNRVWQAYFGTGLVATSEDLGTQSDPPSHKELLDWLSVEFMDSGWSLKHLHRLIVNSATYRQSSKVTPDLLRIDPSNRLLARGPRFRVEGEVVRDIALSVSGRLNPRVGGPPAYPPAPEFLFKPPASYGPKVWNEAKGPERYRRALYTFRFRSVPYPALMAFDTPNGDLSCVRRPRSNTPTQALTTLNEDLFLECARGLAHRALAEGGPEYRDKVAYAFRLCTGRKPTGDEMDVMARFLEAQVDKFSREKARPWDLAADDPSHPPKLPAGVTPARQAAWTALARLLLNLDETITKE